ncbi:MAG TPA: CBS domain-containing protein [Bacillota bacterium]|nr:CBS domain-containing protein [Bacillota bacterium]
MILRDIMTAQVEKVSPESTALDAAKKMQSRDVGAIPVCQGDKVVGIVTDRDIALRVVAEGKDAKTTRCQDIMSKEVISGSLEMDVHEAAQLMADEQIRRLPVIEKGSLVGIVAIGDLAVKPIYVNEAGDALSDISKSRQTLQ